MSVLVGQTTGRWGVLLRTSLQIRGKLMRVRQPSRGKGVHDQSLGLVKTFFRCVCCGDARWAKPGERYLTDCRLLFCLRLLYRTFILYRTFLVGLQRYLAKGNRSLRGCDLQAFVRLLARTAWLEACPTLALSPCCEEGDRESQAHTLERGHDFRALSSHTR